jgi:hypothetical protein
MRSRGTALIMCLCAVLLFAPAAFGQEQSGSIEGVVKDSSGGVLPGVTVEARNGQTSAVATAVTDAKGVYRFPALPPGRYVISATLDGFSPAKVNAELALGQVLKVELALSVGGVQETVQVKGEAPLIDTKQAASFTTINQSTIERIPRGRDFTSVVATAAGAQDEARAGGIQVDGSSGSENRFIIDGMDTTHLRTGAQGRSMMLDFIQEVQVKSSGYNAEFGGSTGGVISAITKSGSNNLRGSVGIYNEGNWGLGDRRGFSRYYPFSISSKGVVANKTPEGRGAVASQSGYGLSEGLLSPDPAWMYVSPVADFGGPALKDKLWYYAGWSYARNDRSRDAIFYADPARVNRHFDWYDWSNYLNYNATSQVTNNLRIRFSGSNQRSKTRGAPWMTMMTSTQLNQSGAPMLEPDNDPIGFPDGTPMKGYTRATFLSDPAAFDRKYRLNGQDDWNNTYAGNVDWVVTSRFFVNATAGYFFTNTTTPEEARGNAIVHSYSGSPSDAYMISQGKPTVPASISANPSGWSDNPANTGTLYNKYSRAFFNVNATWFKPMAGQHTFKTGLRYERFGNDVLDGATKPNVMLYWGTDYGAGAPVGTYGYYELTQQGTVGNVRSNNYSIWFQDTWSLNNKLTLNAGVRAENEMVPSYKAGAPDCNEFPNDPNCAISIRYGMSDKIAPRLGFAYDIKGDSKWKAYGSYSWYYDITKLELPRGSFGGDHWVSYYWTLDTYDYTKIQCGEGSTGCPGRFISSLDWRHSSNQVDPVFEAYFNRPGMTGIDPNLKPVKTGDYQFGLDHELRTSMSLGVRYIHKWAARTIEDVGILAPDPAQPGSIVEDYLISNPGEGLAIQMEPSAPNLVTPKPKRNYDALEFHLTKRLANNWAADATYTYSRLYGNFPGLASSDEWGRNSPNVNRLWDNTVMSYDPQMRLVYGLLNTDRPHQFKLTGSYDFNFGTTVGAYWIMESGAPNSTVARVSSGGYPVFVNGRNDLGRLPVYYNLDMNVSHQLKLGATRRLVLAANFDNVLDLNRITGWYQEQYGQVLWRGSGRQNVALPISYFHQPYDIQAAAAQFRASGGTLWDNSFYKVPDQYSARRRIRISAKFTF